MSVVVVKKYSDRIEMGADSFIGFGHDSQLKDKEAKIFKHNSMIVGCVGFAKDCTLFRLFSSMRKPKENSVDGIIDMLVEFNEWARKKISDYKNESSFMIVYEDKAFFISDTFYVLEIADYRAMGAGQAYAQTALLLGHDVQKAVEVACELSLYCEKPVNLFTTTEK